MAEAPESQKKRATVKDVARVAGVSPGTVSNALSGKRRVDAATQARITDAIEKLGYVPNLAARGMRTGRASTIAIFSSMPVAVAAGQSRLGFLMEIAASAAVSAMESNLALLLIPPIAEPATALGTIGFDGAILVEPSADDPYLALLAARGVPTVVIGPTADMPELAVALDHRQMSRLLFDHLFEVGARRILLVNGQGARASNVAFRDVYMERCKALGLTPDVITLPEADGEMGAQRALEAHIENGGRPDGILVPIDAMATGVMSALHARGLAVPDDVKVVTRYDGLRARSETPPLTALNLHLDQIADLATTLLVQSIETGAPVASRKAPDPELVIRKATQVL